MKARVLSLVIAFITLLAFNNAFAQGKTYKANPQINTSQGTPDLSGELSVDKSSFGVCIDYLRLTGLGDATSVPAYLKIEGTADVCCLSPGQQSRGEDANCTPGQRLSATGQTVNLPVSNGTVTITGADGVCASLTGGCKNQKNFTSTLENVNITKVTINVQGKDIDLTSWYLQTYNN